MRPKHPHVPGRQSLHAHTGDGREPTKAGADMRNVSLKFECAPQPTHSQKQREEAFLAEGV